MWFYLLESLVELALLEQLQDVGLLRLVVQVCRVDGCSSCRSHCLHDAGGDNCLLLFHRQTHLSFDNSLHMTKNGLLQTVEGEDRKLPFRFGALQYAGSVEQEKENMD